MTQGPARRSRAAIARLALLALALGACARGEGDPAARARQGVLRFSIPAAGSAATPGAWRPILADLAGETGLRIDPYVARDPALLAEAMRRGRTDAGWVSSDSALRAVRRGGGEVFAGTVAAGGADTSVMIVRAASPLTLRRVMACDRRLTLGLGDGHSIAGALAPMAYLFAPAGLDPKRCFKAVTSAGPAADLAAVAAGRLDVAAGGSAALAAAGLPPARAVRVIWRSPPLPGDSLVWRRGLDPAAKEKLRQFFLTYGQGDGAEAARQRANLARIGVAAFRPADDSQLLPAREMEAASAWGRAMSSRDPARIAAAARAFAVLRAERQALEARTGAPAATQ